jgi:hypothetical protein
MRSAFILLAVLAACEVPPDRPPESPAPPAAGAAQPQMTVNPPAAQSPPDGVQLTVTEANGLDPALLGKVYGAAKESLGNCRQSGGGTVHVRLERKGTSVSMHIEAGATLDPRAHECVLQALSTVELPDTAANAGGPQIPPSGFTSLLTLSW